MEPKTNPVIYLATGNLHKLEEIRAMVHDLPLQILAAGDLGVVDWEETGNNFAANAQIKVEALANLTQEAILADDSGLVVPALRGEPGIYSSRYAGPNASDQQNMDKLIEKLKGLPEDQRQAYFTCVLCFRNWQNNLLYFEGRCSGHLILEPRGDQGFGYDPIFVPDGTTRSLAELSSDEKNKISHRRRAFDQWLADLQLPEKSLPSP